MLHAEEVEDGQVLSGLGHDAFVRGDDEEGEVDATDAGEHVLDESLMAGHVDKADVGTVGQLQPGEPEVDGHAPGLLFFETVRVDARQRLNQG